MHTGMGSGDPGWANGGDGASYVMSDWVGRRANKIIMVTVPFCMLAQTKLLNVFKSRC